jgi:RNA polymerase sigma-70 factor (ECF subfamily)
MSLARTLLSAAAVAAAPLAPPDDHALEALDARLAAIVTAARAAWPAIEIDADQLVRYLAARLPAGLPIDDALDRLRTDDLYLACGCAHGDAAAQVALDRLLGDIRPAVVAVAATSDAADDVAQTLRERLLFGEPPKIEDYAGTGDLVAWLRVVAVRTALGLRRDHKRDAGLGDAVATAAPLTYVTQDPQLEHLKRVYHAEFQESFRESLQTLDDRERGLLKHRYVHGANVDELSKIYAVHRATAARWVTRAEEKLHAATRKALMQRLRIDRSELDSVMRLLQSQLDASFHDLLSQAD